MTSAGAADPIGLEICRLTSASSARRVERIQSLWSGYGQIVRYAVSGLPYRSVVVKQVSPPTEKKHPRGWTTSHSHERKLRSYEVEQSWYEHFAPDLPAVCRIPALLGASRSEGCWQFVLEDLDAAGYPGRPQLVGPPQIRACLRWLAHFHAANLHRAPTSAQGGNLWPKGTYWHLETRPEERLAMAKGPLFHAAAAIDEQLHRASYRTLVHGDAKLANFCFADDSTSTPPPHPVAVVDFQYVGGGCGVQDVAYFFSSCLSSAQCQAHADTYLDEYFDQLRRALSTHCPPVDGQAVERQWRPLYCVAWADFQRFLLGWAPDHYKLHDYGRAQATKALQWLGQRPAPPG